MSKLSPGRSLAVKATAQVRERDAHVENALDSVVRCAQGVGQKDKAFAELLATGVVSTRGTLDEIIDRSMNSPSDIDATVRDALRISAYEFAFLDKQPHAVVDQGVELVRSVAPRASRLGNAVLHRMAVDMKKFPWGNPNTDDAALARKMGFPHWLARLLIDALGRKDAVVFMAACNQPAPLFLAVNAMRAEVDEVFELLKSRNGQPEIVGSAERGCIRCGNARATIATGVLKSGAAVVSDASAQIVALMATPAKGLPFLEVGSGRGTKTVMLQSNALKYNGEQAELHCVDLHQFKNGVLEKRIADCGLENVHLHTGDATHLDRVEGLPPLFGKALVDAPCSGLGTLRRHPEIRWNMTREKIAGLARVQLALLRSAATRIEPGGQLVYSTCTVAPRENEGVVEAFLASAEGAGFSVREQGGRRFVQNRLVPGGPDVHFCAVLVKEK